MNGLEITKKYHLAKLDALRAIIQRMMKSVVKKDTPVVIIEALDKIIKEALEREDFTKNATPKEMFNYMKLTFKALGLNFSANEEDFIIQLSPIVFQKTDGTYPAYDEGLKLGSIYQHKNGSKYRILNTNLKRKIQVDGEWGSTIEYELLDSSMSFIRSIKEFKEKFTLIG